MDEKDIDKRSCMHCIYLKADIKSNIPFKCLKERKENWAINVKNDCPQFDNQRKTVQ